MVAKIKRKDKKTKTLHQMVVQIDEGMLYDKLHTLSIEYSISIETLVNVAVKHLVDDVELVRNLRIGKIK